METDSLFNRIFHENPKLIFELLGEEAPKTSYTFGSYELKQTSLRTDGVLSPQSKKSPLIFMEAQGYRDREKIFYASFFTKIFLYLRDYQPANDWRAVAIFTRKSLDPGVPKHYSEFDRSGRLQRIYLDQMPEELGDGSFALKLVQLMGMKNRDAVSRAKLLLTENYHGTSDVMEQRKLLEWVVTVFAYKFPKLERQEIEAMFGLSELKQTRFYQEIEEEVGPRERLEGARSVVLDLLDRKVGSIPPQILERINDLSSEHLRLLSLDLLEFGSIADLKAWLVDHASI